MAVLSSGGQLNRPPDNVGSGDYTVSMPSYNAQNAAFPIEIDAALITTPGRYVVIKSTAAITNYAGATFAWVNGSNPLVCTSISKEPVS